jgi:hypothetical protein
LWRVLNSAETFKVSDTVFPVQYRIILHLTKIPWLNAHPTPVAGFSSPSPTGSVNEYECLRQWVVEDLGCTIVEEEVEIARRDPDLQCCSQQSRPGDPNSTYSVSNA